MVEYIEKEHYGLAFGLMLHYDLHLPLAKILQLTQAASKIYDRLTNTYVPKPLLFDPYHVSSRTLRGERVLKYIAVPRIAPPATKLLSAMRELESNLGVSALEDGRIATKSFVAAVEEMIAQDPGRYGMPELSQYIGGRLEFPMIISFDGTGYGSQQFNTIALRNPYQPHSALQLRIFGLGNCSDDKNGTRRLLGENLDVVNHFICCQDCVEVTPVGSSKPINIKPHIYVVTDLAALRHTERLANSGFCCCSRDAALRETPKAKPRDGAELRLLLAQCRIPTVIERYVWSHNPPPGEDVPRPCTALGCMYAHDATRAMDEYTALKAEEERLRSVETRAGRAAFARFRLQHAHSHNNIQPADYGKPLLHHDMADQILDSLHYSKLGLGKIPWKYGILNNASDDARDAISNQLKAWKHPLDCRRKDDNRARAQKWFNGEAFSSFLAGHGGSPGGPIAIATLVFIIADDMQQRGVSSGPDESLEEPQEQLVVVAPTVPPRAPPPCAHARGGRRAQFIQANAAMHSIQASQVEPSDEAVDNVALRPHAPPMIEHQPTSMEREASSEDLAMIRAIFGPRSQTIINALLAWDAFLAWYYALEDIVCVLFDTEEAKESAALLNCSLAIDMHEIFERVSIRTHKSFLPHAAIFKVSMDILRVGDVKQFNTSALELLNAHTKRTANSSGSRRLTTSSSGVKRASMKSSIGPGRLSLTKGYSTSMVLSTLKHLMVSNVLHRGNGLYATPECRRRERLFGESGRGRVTLPSSGVKLEERLMAVDGEYKPSHDTCVKAFVRLLGARAEVLLE